MSLFDNSATIAIRVDSSSEVGSGHVMRCLTLADCLRQYDINIRFICQRLPGDLVEIIFEKGYQVESALSSKVDWLIVDHYNLDKKWETEMRSLADGIMVIDDLANREHDCDLLLDQTLGRVKDDYCDLVPKNCRLLLGTNYTLIAPKIRQLRAHTLERRRNDYTVKTLLISMGGTDPNNVSGFVKDSLQQLQFKSPIKIVLGKHMDQSLLAKIMAISDLSIGAGGTMSWERCCLGLPTLMISIADNQLQIAKRLHKIGAAHYLGHYDEINLNGINNVVQRFIQNPSLLEKMSHAAASICDGFGAMRVATELFPECAKDGVPVQLRRANMKDADIMLTWQHDPTTREFARNPNKPNRSEHMKWLKKRLSDSNCVFNIITYKNEPAGILRLDKIEHANDTYEISIVTAPEYRRLGLASAALRLARKLLPDVELRAEVLPGNNSSHYLFQNEGYELSDGIYIHKVKERL